MFKAIKRYYDLKIYNKENLSTFVRVEWITPEEYKEITGVDYESQA